MDHVPEPFRGGARSGTGIFEKRAKSNSPGFAHFGIDPREKTDYINRKAVDNRGLVGLGDRSHSYRNEYRICRLSGGRIADRYEAIYNF
jgi:hypothetical protein